MHDVVSGNRILCKVFGEVSGSRAFNVNDEFDVLRVLAEFAKDNLHDKSLSSNFVAFVRNPVKPKVLQRVGVGVPYDVCIEDKNYIVLNGELKSFGYEILFDLTDLYKLGRIILDYRNKQVYVPGTEVFDVTSVFGVTIENKTYTSNLEDIWVIPKLQFCSSDALARNFPFYSPKPTLK